MKRDINKLILLFYDCLQKTAYSHVIISGSGCSHLPNKGMTSFLVTHSIVFLVVRFQTLKLSCSVIALLKSDFLPTCTPD